MDYRSIINLIIVMVNYAFYDFYLYELFWGDWNKASAKSLFYIISFFVLLYFVFDELRGYYTLNQYRIKIAYLILLSFTFLLFSIILNGTILHYPKTVLFIYNSLIISVIFIILFNGIKFKIFK